MLYLKEANFEDIEKEYEVITNQPERKNITIKPITAENKAAFSLPNDPFLNEGKVIPIYDGNQFTYRIEFYKTEEITTDCFPDEHYDFDNMGKDIHGIAAYLDEECAGFALLSEQWNHYLYLDNLLVPKKYRRLGVGSALLKACMELANSMQKQGVWLICQDNNLGAFQFYIRNGFTLGGMDLFSYDGTKQEGKGDLYLYQRRKS